MKKGNEKINDPLPVHSIEFPIRIEDIHYKNPYDFTKEHRHNYFEILFFKTGGGSQLVDFIEFPVIANSCYIVFPQQVHLLKRGEGAFGTVVQFDEEIIPSALIKNRLRQLSFGVNATRIFENSPQKSQACKPVLDLIKQTLETGSVYSQEIALNYLQALLFQLIERKETSPVETISGEIKLLYDFQNLLEEQFLENHSVQKYTALLNTTEKKLSTVTKKHLGSSPLQVIHNRVLVEAKRILLFENITHKEIAFRLGFDSPASFSQFIKNKTGFTPSELHANLVTIHS